MSKAEAKHEIAYQELNALLQKLADEHNLSAVELLATACNLVGKMIAMQDQRTMSRDRAMRIVAVNIEIGNAQCIAELKNKTAGSA